MHVDACLMLFDPNSSPESIPNKRIVKHVNLFRQGELQRLIYSAFRKYEDEVLSTGQVLDSIIEDGDYPDDARKALSQRIRSSLNYLKKQGKVEKIGERADARWKLI